MSEFFLRLSFAGIVTACFDFEFEVLQFIWGIAWFNSALASTRIFDSSSGWKDSVVYCWFRRPLRKPPDAFDSSVSQIAHSRWLLSVPPKISQDLLIVEFQNQGGINCLTLPKHPSSLLRFKIIPLRKPIHWITQAHIWLPSATLPIMTRNAWSIVFCISHSSTLDCNEC